MQNERWSLIALLAASNGFLQREHVWALVVIFVMFSFAIPDA
jgi:hypothetical protein